jgi:hypothetical protein
MDSPSPKATTSLALSRKVQMAKPAPQTIITIIAAAAIVTSRDTGPRGFAPKRPTVRSGKILG